MNKIAAFWNVLPYNLVEIYRLLEESAASIFRVGSKRLQKSVNSYHAIRRQIVRCHGMEMSVGKTKIIRISRQLSPVQIMADQKQPENVEYLNHLVCMINEARRTREIKSRIALAKATFNKKKTLFTRKLDVNLRKKLVKSYIWSIALYGAETWTLRK
jgi:hypothetical protein